MKQEDNAPILLDINYMKDILTKSIDMLYEKDKHLVIHNLAERAIAHRLAVHLESNFSNDALNVDCEYNGDVENDGLRKAIDTLSIELAEVRKDVNTKEEWTELSVFPDIIIHKRGSNLSNNLIIEIKKRYPNYQVADKFDLLKLKAYTSVYNKIHRNHLAYRLGAYIEFDTDVKNPLKSYRIIYFSNGYPDGDSADVNSLLPLSEAKV